MDSKKSLHLDRRAAQIAASVDGPADELIDTAKLAAWLGVSSHWAKMARRDGYGPPFLRLSTCRIRYRRGDVIAWLQERQHLSIAEYAGR